MSLIMEKICRTCFKTIQSNEHFSYLQQHEQQLFQPISILKILIADFDDKIVSDAVLCDSCSSQLYSTFVFRTMCLENELKLKCYSQQLECRRNLVYTDFLEIRKEGKRNVKFEKESRIDSEQIGQQIESVVVKKEKDVHYGDFEANLTEISKENVVKIKLETAEDSNGFEQMVEQTSSPGVNGGDYGNVCVVENNDTAQTNAYNHPIEPVVTNLSREYYDQPGNMRTKGYIGQNAPTKDIKKKNKLKSFKCSICCKCFAKSCSLRSHMKSKHLSQPFKCLLCVRSYSTEAKLRKHVRAKHEETRKNRSDTRKSVEHKQPLHTNKMCFKCHICKKQFKDNNSLNDHVRSHSKRAASTRVRPRENPFECKTCGKFFPRESSLVQHFEHHPDTPFVEYLFQCKRSSGPFRTRECVLGYEDVPGEEK